MADGTKIEWTDATWNVVNGCSVVSPGCTNCYAMKQAHRVECRRGLTKHTNGGMVWTGEVRFNEKVLLDPLRWRRPRRIFVCAHGDLFHENVPDEWIDKVFAVMALAHWHTFQVLTKRPERQRAYLTERWQPAPAHRIELPMSGRVIDVPAEKEGDDRWTRVNSAIDDIIIDDLFNQDRFWTSDGSLIGRPAWPRQPLPNLWLGTSVEDQKRADERIHHLLSTPAAVRWLSCEPLLGALDLRHLQPGDPPTEINALAGTHGVLRPHGGTCEKIDWIVVGGESGPDARPMHPDWARSLRDQCAAAGVPFLFKQWGAYSDAHAEAIGDISFSEGIGQGEIAWPDGTVGHGRAEERGGPGRKLTNWHHKRDAGRLLDGVEHNGYPDQKATQ